MKKLSLLIIAGLFMLSTQTVNAQFDINKNINKAKQENAKSKENKKEKEKQEQAKKEKEEKAQKEQEKQAAEKAKEKDHPLVSRFEGAEMIFYKETKWGGYKLPVSDKGIITWKNSVVLEGKVTRIQYTVSDENNAEFVLHNYKAAFKKSGFNILIAIANEELKKNSQDWYGSYYSIRYGLNNEKFGLKTTPINGSAHCFIAASGHDNENNKDVYAIIYSIEMDGYTLITQDVIEVEPVETGLVSAANISDDITTQGYIAIYGIYFETGQSVIKAQSKETINTIAGYLNNNPDKSFYIVGHTDNTGDFSANKTLSEERAKSVMNELTTNYNVSAEQLEAYGVSSLAPVTSNMTEEGRTKNRRVEIVIQ